jgi:hypothetical protein
MVIERRLSHLQIQMKVRDEKNCHGTSEIDTKPQTNISNVTTKTPSAAANKVLTH